MEGGLFNNEGTIIPAFGFALITDEKTRVYNNFNVSPEAIKLYVDDGAIGNGLANTQDKITLYDNNNNTIDQLNYSKPKKGLSIALENNQFFDASPTPGFENNGSTLAFEEGTCDWQLAILLNQTIFNNPGEFEWRMRANKIFGNSTNISGTAEIIDLFGNTIKTYKPWTNQSATRQKTSTTYTPNLQEAKTYILKAAMTSECQDLQAENNIDEQIFSILGTTAGNGSEVTIVSLQDLGKDTIAKFGQIIRVKIEIYKGDTTKEVVALWIENNDHKITKQSKYVMENKFEKRTLTLLVMI